MQFTKPAPIEIRQTDEDNNELKDESDMTIFEDEKISELIDSGMDIVQGFESEDVMSNLAAGQALGTILREIAQSDGTNNLLRLVTSMLPMVANTLEDEDAMDRISDLMRITGDALESKSFQRNAAAGVRFSKTTLEDDRIGEALSSGMEVLSSVLARPEISTAINTAGSSFNSAISHPSLQTGVKRVMESPRVNRAVNTTVKSSVSVAQQLMKNEQLSTVTRTGMDYGTRMLNDANVQQAVKRTVSNGAYYTKRVLDNETLGAAANTSTNVALSILGSGVVTGAANSTWELARGVVTSDQVVKSWGVLASTFEYFTAIPERSVEEMEQDLQVMKDIAEPEIAELQELEAKLAAEEIILRAKYDSLKSEIRGVRSKQVNIATRIKVAEAQLEVARNRLLDLEADDEQTTSTTAGTLDDQLERS